MKSACSFLALLISWAVFAVWVIFAVGFLGKHFDGVRLPRLTEILIGFLVFVTVLRGLTGLGNSLFWLWCRVRRWTGLVKAPPSR